MKKIIILIIIVMICKNITAQIVIPEGFTKIGNSNSPNVTSYKNGNYYISLIGFGSLQWENDECWLMKNLGVAFKKTKDDLLIGTGYVNNNFVYIIVNKYIIYLSSTVNGQKFSQLSEYLLKEAIN